jgi:hypothetical protein
MKVYLVTVYYDRHDHDLLGVAATLESGKYIGKLYLEGSHIHDPKWQDAYNGVVYESEAEKVYVEETEVVE